MGFETGAGVEVGVCCGVRAGVCCDVGVGVGVGQALGQHLLREWSLDGGRHELKLQHSRLDNRSMTILFEGFASCPS